jgi:hypothetical protein
MVGPDATGTQGRKEEEEPTPVLASGEKAPGPTEVPPSMATRGQAFFYLLDGTQPAVLIASP